MSLAPILSFADISLPVALMRKMMDIEFEARSIFYKKVIYNFSRRMDGLEDIYLNRLEIGSQPVESNVCY